MKLPVFQTDNKDLSLMQTKWRATLDPVLANPSLQSIILENVALKAGVTHVNHKLGRKPVGWRVIRLRNAAQVHDNQDDNQRPDLTLDLVSNTAVSADLEVF